MCFKEFKERQLVYLLNDLSICPKCFKELQPKFIFFNIDKYRCLSIFEYDDKIKALLYQFKGCFDIEMGDIFLKRYSHELHLYYLGYKVIPIPSYKEDDEKRQFNHVKEMFRFLDLPIVDAIEKTNHVKQANCSFEQRKEIGKHLRLIDGVNLKGKKVLIVDDVYTTGSTMKAAIELIKKLEPKKIKVLVMSKTVEKQFEHE